MLQTTYLQAGWEFCQTGKAGSKVGFSTTEWLPAQVPGHVHLDLMANGIIADPFVRMNELGCQWVDETDWSYRTKFTWSEDPTLPRRVLRFEGLDTVCEIYLNGEKVADHDNMFVVLELDVTDKLIEGENTLEVQFQSATRVGRARRKAFFEKHQLAANTVRFDERAFVRKAQYMYGWDWGPRLVSCGIWQPVSLLQFAARFTDIHITQTHRKNDLVEVTVTSTIEGEGTPVHRIDGIGTLVGNGSFLLHRPDRWDPEEPVTMSLVSAILPADVDPALFGASPEDLEVEEDANALLLSQTVLIAEESLDLRVQSIGIIEVKLVREADEIGESFEFIVNGRPLWIRGANWIPDHSFPSTVDRSRLRDRLEKAVDLGCNMLRVWGGGLYESDAFYELCDELGILVWQDFPFACSYYPEDDEHKAIIRAEAAQNIRRIRNHPSLALWCGNNENHEMYFNSWGGKEFNPERFFGLELYEETLPGVLAELDPERSYIASSPIGSPPADAPVKDEKRRGPNADSYGDQHNWDVWHGRGDWRHYTESKARFSSEYGFCAAPSALCYREVLTTEDWSPHSPALRWHDKTGKGDATFHGYVELHYPVSQTVEDWVYYSQLNQRDALRYGIEHYRRSDFCRGSIIWQLNDCWPTQSWAVLDSNGAYKAAAYELRRLHDDILVSIVRDNDEVAVHLVNDGTDAIGGYVRLTAYSTLTGEALREFNTEAEVEGNERTIALTGSIAGLSVSETVLIASFIDVETWQLLGEPKATRFEAPAPLVVSTANDGGIRVQLSGPVVDLYLTVDGDPSPFLDNFITSTDSSVEIRVSRPITNLQARSLAGVHPVRVTRSPL